MPLGTKETYGGIFEILKAADITDPEQIKLELARVLAIQKQSQSASLATFVAGMASPGVKAFLSSGGDLPEAALLLLQAREASTNDAQAQAAADGPRAEAGLLREGFEPGQFPILKAAFSETARETSAKARKAAAGVLASEIDKKIHDFRESQIGEERLQAADIEFSGAMTGIEVYDFAKLLELAEHRWKLRLASPDVSKRKILQAVIAPKEIPVEAEAMEILRERIFQLEKQGVDVSAAIKAWEAVGWAAMKAPYIGVSDWHLDKANKAVNATIQDAATKASVGGGNVNVQVNQTNIGTAYLDNMPDRHSPPYADVGD
ncbi:MAG: hypothetical protein KAV82_13560 [Phycisphaerae bacterium]|nr:hypothetical protein [Phycisphaerae bacterium]